MKVNLDHLNLTVNDILKSIDWYKRVFGFEVVERNEPEKWAILRAGETMLCLYQEESRAFHDRFKLKAMEIHGMCHFAFKIEDTPTWIKTMEREKLKPLYDGKIDYPFSTSWYVKDPTGYEIEVVAWDNNVIRFHDL